MRSNCILFLLSMLTTGLFSQVDTNIVYQTFSDTRVINSHSVELIKKGELDFRVGHRFGDMLGDAGGWETFYGLENASDVLFGFEYGLSDNAMIGLSRTKGSGPLKSNISALTKFKLVNQKKHGNSVSIAVVGMVTGSTMPKSSNKGVLNYFAEPAHRYSYHAEMIIGRKFSDRFSFQINGAFTYRNIVASNDVNELPSIGASTKIQLSKPIAILLEGRQLIAGTRNDEIEYFPMLGVALEWKTGGGHTFQFNLTNSGGMIETDYIPYTTQDFTEGEFRIGFTISRLFKI